MFLMKNIKTYKIFYYIYFEMEEKLWNEYLEQSIDIPNFTPKNMSLLI